MQALESLPAFSTPKYLSPMHHIDGPAKSPFAIAINKELFHQAQRGVTLLRELISRSQQAKVGHSESSIPTQIAELAKLRDQGVLTLEEFESKKKDLLSRM